MKSRLSLALCGPPKMTAPLDFDQRHKLSINVGYELDKGQGPVIGNWHPFENLGIDLLYNVTSGTPYTPTKVYNEVTLAAVSSEPAGPINSRYGPWNASLDLKATRSFTLLRQKLEGFVWVLNAFDTKNPVAVFSSTGSAETSGWLNTPDGQAFLANAQSKGLDGAGLYRLAESDPNFYSNPRLVRFGVRTNF